MQSPLTSAQTDLLTAAFLPDQDAIAAWVRWRDGVDWDGHLDHTSFMLLPLVYRNLNRLGVEDLLFPRFKGIIRQAWLANQRWTASIEPTLAACTNDGIEVLILPPTQRILRDGSAVMNRQEPMSWAVRSTQAEPMISCLLSSGWKSHEVRLPRWSLTGYVLGTRHLMLRHDTGQGLMLTWGMEWWFGDRTDAVWTGADHARLGRQPVRSLNAADALALTLREPISDQPFTRIADALLIADNGALNWRRLEDAVRHCPPASDWSSVLAPLQPFFDSWGAPPQLQSWFTTAPADSPPARPRVTLLQRYRDDWGVYRMALGNHRGPTAALVQLPGYLMGRWRLHGLGDLPKRLLAWFDPDFRASQSERQ